MTSEHPSRTLLWFRRNLRIDDQPLFEGLAGQTIGVWVLDPQELLSQDPLGFPRCGDHRLQFILESVADLRRSMRELGTDLLVRVGEPEAIIPQLASEAGATDLRFIREPGTEERGVEKRLLNAMAHDLNTCTTEALPLETLFDIQDVLSHASELPEVFSKWRRWCEKKLGFVQPTPQPSVIEPLDAGIEPGDIPSLKDLDRTPPAADRRSVLSFSGGEQAGQQRLRSWVFDGDHLRRYKETRNGLIGESYSSKLSPWLALGCLSPRRVAEQTLAYEQQRVSNDSTYWLRFELMWREYFRFYLLKHGRSLFNTAGPQQVPLQWSQDAGRFHAWYECRTGIDFIDANMRELARTGFMSNRGRQNVASFLTKNLGIDWRWGARWFESCLVDYCPAANWGNWAYAAGVGADPRGFRGFDVVSQARRYDPESKYTAMWLSDRDENVRPMVDPSRSLSDAESRWQAATRLSPS
ncbi:MAG: DASH family cryptochrome [Planctomycetota bacterium]